MTPVTPSLANTAGVAAAAHSAMIATNERAPAMTAHPAIARIPGSWCRSPHGFRGSGTAFRAASNAAGAFGTSGNSSSSNWSTCRDIRPGKPETYPPARHRQDRQHESTHAPNTRRGAEAKYPTSGISITETRSHLVAQDTRTRASIPPAECFDILTNDSGVVPSNSLAGLCLRSVPTPTLRWCLRSSSLGAQHPVRNTATRTVDADSSKDRPASFLADIAPHGAGVCSEACCRGVRVTFGR